MHSAVYCYIVYKVGKKTHKIQLYVKILQSYEEAIKMNEVRDPGSLSW